MSRSRGKSRAARMAALCAAALALNAAPAEPAHAWKFARCEKPGTGDAARAFRCCMGGGFYWKAGPGRCPSGMEASSCSGITKVRTPTGETGDSVEEVCRRLGARYVGQATREGEKP